MNSTREVLYMDWQQVVLNGGPPCFATLDDEAGWFCGRAQRWAGHDGDHKFVSLQDYLQHHEQEVRERCAVIAETHSATDCNGPDCGVVIAAAIRSQEGEQSSGK